MYKNPRERVKHDPKKMWHVMKEINEEIPVLDIPLEPREVSLGYVPSLGGNVSIVRN